MRRGHVLCPSKVSFAISAHLQDSISLLGQSVVYSEASQIFEELLNIDISSSQIQRVCRYYGGILDSIIEKGLEECIPHLEGVKKEDNVYVMVDGSMLFTRPKEWKEIKLARIFNNRKIVPINSKRKEVVESIYVSHMGSVDQFFPKLERHLTRYKKKTIIGDGATWIWKWVDDNYPGATQILDFYHAKEKLVVFANLQFKDNEKRKSWISTQSEQLLDNSVEEVIINLQKMRSKNQKAKELKEKAIKYYEDHCDKMMYKTYREQGLLIGSGPIEAAHRNVLQQRMKLSGQKWTVKGANAIANLRCYKKSGAWKIIKNIIRAA